MNRWHRFLIPLLILTMLSSIPGIPLGIDLRGYPLVLHLATGSLFAAVLVLFLFQPPTKLGRLSSLSWLLISSGLIALVVPMLGWVSAEEGHLWLETHGWLSIGGLGLLGLSASLDKKATGNRD